MLRSMYSGISGMKGFQSKLDVIGNNIANVNTFGFKKGRVTFKDMISQTISGASAASPTIGGTNAKQVGLGTQISSIDTIHTQGNIQTTGRPLDISISGDGYFVVENGPETLYSRAGNFYLDENGSLVNSEGLFVKSISGANISIPTNAKSYSISSNGDVVYVASDGTSTTLGPIAIAKFANNEGLEKVGGNTYRETQNSGVPTTNNVPGTNGTGFLVSGALEMSNVDLSEEFTEMIVAQRGFQANTRIITTSDEILQELVNLKR
ncbi:MAG: flgG [Bacillales bacterium]|nr:flgG [Bacillales bacterium]